MFDRRGEAFQRALDEARRNDRSKDEDSSRFARRPRVRADAELGRAPGSGGKARFDLALDWTSEPADQFGPQPALSGGEDPLRRAEARAEIAEELGLGAALTADGLAARWRNFVWRNHPDRQPSEARERATARVAIANALYDQARLDRAKER